MACKPSSGRAGHPCRCGPTSWCEAYLASDAPAARLVERKESLYPWVNDKTRAVAPDTYVSGDTVFKLGGLTFHVLRAGPAHTPEDLMLFVEEDGVLFVGDLMFTGRIPFVADADVTSWIHAIDRVPGPQAAHRGGWPRPGIHPGQ